MFDSLEILKNGNEQQKNAYKATCMLGILNDLKQYSPVLCGTLPLNIATSDSDLDIILEVSDLQSFSQEVRERYGDFSEYKTKQKIIRNRQVMVTSFWYQGFEFQIFAQNQQRFEQYAYLHMVIEWHILQEHPEWKELIRDMKIAGTKTEPAFCTLLNLEGNPYDMLIDYGKSKGWI